MASQFALASQSSVTMVEESGLIGTFVDDPTAEVETTVNEAPTVAIRTPTRDRTADNDRPRRPCSKR